MSEGKKVNLLKAAKELNIGIGTAVEHLKKNGFEIESKPNTRLSSEMYGVLLKEFQGDKSVKEEANQIVIGKIRREEAAAESKVSVSQTEKEPSPSSQKLDQPEPQAKEPVVEKKEEPKTEKEESKGNSPLKVVGKIDLDSLQKPRKAKVEEKKEAVQEKAEVKEEKVKETVAPKKEEVKEKEPVETPEQKPAEKEQPKVEKPAAETGSKTEDKKEEIRQVIEEKPAAKPSAEKKQQEPKKEKPVKDGAANKSRKPKGDKKDVSPKREDKSPKGSEKTNTSASKTGDDVIRIRTTTLAGPKVVGKIELPQERSKGRPVASSDSANKERRKRRRKKTQNPVVGGTQAKAVDGKSERHSNRARGGGRRKQKKEKKEELTDKDIQEHIKATLARLSGAGKSTKFAQRARLRRRKRDDIALSAEEAARNEEIDSKVLKVTEFVTANELANLMDVQVTDVIATCMNLGIFVSINQRLDAETLTIVADEYGFEIEFIRPEDEETTSLEEPDIEENLVSRAPIVTVMGHVDHGKTSLLDYIRKSDVTRGEAGGITQHIGAYAVKLENDKTITFLDTPGHEAFTAMRARGAQVTDVVIIVIAADDGVMPQTKEAINHAQAAGVPIVFAFTKVDKPTADPNKLKEQLANMNILVEDWGGKYQSQEVSSKTGLNIDLLLEKVLLEAELLDLKADPKKRAVGSVVEASLDVGRGIVTTVLVQSGTLRIGDAILAGSYSGKVKALSNERGERVKEVGPSMPIQILGMSGAPTAGDKFYILESETEARHVATKRLQLQREQGMRATKHITLDEIGRRLAIGNFKELNIIVKGDVDGSIEALSDSLLKLSKDEIQVNVIHKSVGAISESDVLLASASDAIIIGFQVRPTLNARKLAEQEQIDIRLYSIIYDAIEEIKSAMEGMLAPKYEEKIVANVEIREVFKISKVGTIAGCMVLDGKIHRNNDVRIIREGVVVFTGKLASLKRFKDDVREVSSGFECGLNIEGYNDIKVGDIVEAYEQVEVKRTL
ncbi:MAG TPA: translation initiation factor IF-2 [Candidatus Sphingobacterium stercoripullorum]|uniref:Translation initiation factor IF-2 n=1 Tax=Candidatus Sphingobacterium stercoripullorum TaxID=2838759 RepID=A0A9D1WAL2_9SPHI|nr:translation initiation factor IF-2 [Candidatus Sphingobacterium stercoripullorum]HLR49355.1 translation initiation factor IF-2 [Candidatus Sphingobacterium stercoripullorum]